MNRMKASQIAGTALEISRISIPLVVKVLETISGAKQFF